MPQPNASLALHPGTRIAGYEIVRPLGQGGFGITYEAYNRVVKRRVAIKEFFPAGIASREGATQVIFPGDTDGIVSWALRRFEESTSALADLQHRNIIDVMNYVSDHGTGYMVMEHVDGETLSDWLGSRHAKPGLDEIRPLLDPVFDALEYMHGRNFLHRDVAPDNIMLRKNGEPVLIDFGAIKSIEEETLFRAGTSYPVAKRHYSSPEQTGGSTKLDARTDVYSAAAVLYRSITGVPPEDSGYRGGDIINGRPDPYVPVGKNAGSNLPVASATLIDRSLSLRRDERPASIGALRNGLGWKSASDRQDKIVTDKIHAVTDASQQEMQEREQTASKRSAMPLLAAGLALAVVGGVIYTALNAGAPKPNIPVAEKPKEPEPTQSRSTPPRVPRQVPGESTTFFDPANGQAVIWFSRSASGDYEFFDADGYHPRTGAKLQLVDRQVVRDWQTREEERRKPQVREPTLADGHVWCRSRYGEHAIAAAVERNSSTPFSCTCRDGYTWNPTTTFCVPMQARIPTFLERVEVGRWAVGGAQFCNTPSRVYTLSVINSNDIAWIDGTGKRYVERVVYTDQGEFHTRTVSSPSDPAGTSWIYRGVGTDGFQVIKGSGAAFTAVRCP